MYVFDATPLIVLASADRLSLVDALEGDRAIPESVQAEAVDAGAEAGHADARRIDRAIESGRFDVEPDPENELVERLEAVPALSEADVAVLALAAEREGIAVMDEQQGRTVAETEGIATRGTAFVVLHAQRRGIITAEQSQDTIDALVEAGWYCSTDLYAAILEKIADIE